MLGFSIGCGGTYRNPISLHLTSWKGGWREGGASVARRGARRDEGSRSKLSGRGELLGSCDDGDEG